MGLFEVAEGFLPPSYHFLAEVSSKKLELSLNPPDTRPLAKNDTRVQTERHLEGSPAWLPIVDAGQVMGCQRILVSCCIHPAIVIRRGSGFGFELCKSNVCDRTGLLFHSSLRSVFGNENKQARRKQAMY